VREQSPSENPAWSAERRHRGAARNALDDQGAWDPCEHYWGERDDPIQEWAKPIIARGPRQAFEMEQVLPGSDPDDPDSDPITQSNDLKDAGNAGDAFRFLMDLCQADLRCLDAHAHLGNFEFDRHPALAIRHYEAGFRIGELSLREAFDGLLPWGHIDNPNNTEAIGHGRRRGFRL